MGREESSAEQCFFPHEEPPLHFLDSKFLEINEGVQEKEGEGTAKKHRKKKTSRFLELNSKNLEVSREREKRYVISKRSKDCLTLVCCKDVYKRQRNCVSSGGFGFEEVAYLLLFGELPDKWQLEEFLSLIHI